ncbi:hypothetical protein NMG60_11008116 [Bertholletia excelsa]
MAQIKLLLANICIFLSLFQSICPSQGRKMMFLSKNETTKPMSSGVMFRKETKEIADHNSRLLGEITNKTENVNESVPTTPVAQVVPNSGGDVSQQPPPPGHVDDFRPTAPGHSPGIGHSTKN